MVEANTKTTCGMESEAMLETGREQINKAESRRTDASSVTQSHPELPRVTLSHSELLKSYQESRRAVQSRPELLRGTPEQSGNGPTDRPTDIPTYRDTRTHLTIDRKGSVGFPVGGGGSSLPALSTPLTNQRIANEEIANCQ